MSQVNQPDSGGGGSTGANPTAEVGPTAVNGVATTFLRSDGAPALADTAVTPGSYTATDLTVDQQGRITAASNGSGGGGDDGILIVHDEKVWGNQGGTSVADTWTTRDLNTEVSNSITGASLASDQITLPAGTYRLTASAPAFRANAHAIRLYNDTDAAVITTGSAEWTNQGLDLAVTRSCIDTRFTLAAEKDLEIQHNVEDGFADKGFGVRYGDAAWGDSIYTMLSVTKEA